MSIFNPDDYLATATEDRVYTQERNAQAWELLYCDLERALGAARPHACLYVVMGVQGGGKTTWIASNRATLGPDALFLDAALPARRHRTRVLALARRFGIRTAAVWIRTSLEQALQRNARRAAGEIVPEAAVRSVFSQLEAPKLDEGFDEIVIVDPTG